MKRFEENINRYFLRMKPLLTFHCANSISNGFFIKWKNKLDVLLQEKEDIISRIERNNS